MRGFREVVVLGEESGFYRDREVEGILGEDGREFVIRNFYRV